MDTTLPGLRPPSAFFRHAKEGRADIDDQRVLGIVEFTTHSSFPSLDEGPPSIQVHLADSAEDEFSEVWMSSGPVDTGMYRSITYSHDGEFMFSAGYVPPGANFAERVESLYTALLELTETMSYPQIFRIWNYLGRINEELPNGLETYREFCLGRARVLERYGIAHDMPAATVIGAQSGGLVCYVLSRRTGEQVNLENPRQVPAYYYPPRYGPKSPNFARATYVIPDTGPDRIYVSGTAGILGHRTVHLGDVERQFELATDNIAYLIGERNLSVFDIAPGSNLEQLDNIKVYVRRRADIPCVERICKEKFSPSATIAILHADICRSDLLVELEGIVTRDDHADERENA